MSKINYQKELNKDQYKIISEGDGHCLVLAGAGSGKTRTLTHRVSYLIERGVPAKNIMLVTFTNKAASEMLLRVSDLLGYNLKGIWGGTFHSIGNRILRKYADVLGYNRNFIILDKEDAISFIKSSAVSMNINLKDKSFPKVNMIAGIISYAANTSDSIEKVISDKYEWFSEPSVVSAITAINNSYQKKKREENAMDFDDLLTNWLLLLEQNEKVRNILQEQFCYILVDEYQDTNRLQAKILWILSQRHRNILTVGDDAKSINSFRGAQIANILNFSKMFSNAKVFKLETNYRSIPEILGLANASIANNSEKFEKNLRAVKKEGELPNFVIFGNTKDQAKFVIREIENFNNLEKTAVLFRSAFSAMELELELSRSGVPYIMRGGMRFFEQKHIKDVLAYFRILTNLKDEIAWRRALMLFPGIGPAGANKIFSQVVSVGSMNELLDVNFAFGGRTGDSLRILFETLKQLQALAREEIIAKGIEIILGSGYKEYLKTSFDNYKERLEDLQQLAIFADQDKSVEEFLAESALAENFRAGEGNDSNRRLVLSTIHQAKGLEWENVFVLGLADGQFPHHRVYSNPRELEEERRLFYVATTRAKEKLYLLYPKCNNRGDYMSPSQFVEELDGELIKKEDKTASASVSDFLDFSFDDDSSQDEDSGEETVIFTD